MSNFFEGQRVRLVHTANEEKYISVPDRYLDDLARVHGVLDGGAYRVEFDREQAEIASGAMNARIDDTDYYVVSGDMLEAEEGPW